MSKQRETNTWEFPFNKDLKPVIRQSYCNEKHTFGIQMFSCILALIPLFETIISTNTASLHCNFDEQDDFLRHFLSGSDHTKLYIIQI